LSSEVKIHQQLRSSISSSMIIHHTQMSIASNQALPDPAIKKTSK